MKRLLYQYAMLPQMLKYNKNIIQLKRGEICVANFIPPANGASQGNYFLAKIQKMAVFDAKTG